MSLSHAPGRNICPGQLGSKNDRLSMHHTARLLLPYALAASSTGGCKAGAASIIDQIMTTFGPCIKIVAVNCLKMPAGGQ